MLDRDNLLHEVRAIGNTHMRALMRSTASRTAYAPAASSAEAGSPLRERIPGGPGGSRRHSIAGGKHPREQILTRGMEGHARIQSVGSG